MLDTRSAAAIFTVFESIASLSRVDSTNTLARRVLDECVQNDLSVPQCLIVADEQSAGRGRGERQWTSPRGGIYLTALVTRSADELPFLPLELANIVASFLRETYGVAARVKWPNDVQVGGRKIAGILTEARVQDRRAHVIAGIGINVEPLPLDRWPGATSIRETSATRVSSVDEATLAFVRHFDRRLAAPIARDRVVDEWRQHVVHQPGDRITCIVGGQTIIGTWSGIDDSGRALLENGSDVVAISAGEFVQNDAPNRH